MTHTFLFICAWCIGQLLAYLVYPSDFALTVVVMISGSAAIILDRILTYFLEK